MKKMNGKLNLWGWYVLGMGILFFTVQCDRKPKTISSEPDAMSENTLKKPQLLIIGEDLSQTFSNFTPINENDLLHLCNAIEKNKNGGAVVLLGIGSTKPQGQLICKLEPLMQVESGMLPSKKKAIDISNKRVKERNKTEITQFIENATEALSSKKQPFTDINGFFDKVTTLVDGPLYEEYEKWLYVNSDGKQDTKTAKKVNCKLKSSSIDHFYTSGWKSTPDCSPDGKFLAPVEFVDFYTQNVKK